MTRLILLVVIALVFGFVLAPLGLIWAINVLVPTLAIPFTLKTWFASLLVVLILSGAKASIKSTS